MDWFPKVVFVVGALLIGLGVTVEKSGTLLIIGIVLAAAGYVLMRPNKVVKTHRSKFLDSKLNTYSLTSPIMPSIATKASPAPK